MQLKVYRRDNRKKPQGGWQRALTRAAMAAGAVAMLALAYFLSAPLADAAVSLREFVLESPYFSVREIQVRGAEKVSGDEVIAMAGLRRTQRPQRSRGPMGRARVARPSINLVKSSASKRAVA